MRKLLVLAAGLQFFMFYCRHEESRRSEFLFPEEGALIKRGEKVKLQIDAAYTADSIVYYIDSTLIAVKTDTTPVFLDTHDSSFGSRLLTARIYQAGEEDEVTANIIILPAAPPVNYQYEIISTFPHDTSSYTQGLEFHDGLLYESDGEYGGSSLRKVDVSSGKVLKKTDMPANVFAEGLTVIGSKLILLTWQNGIGMIYDKNSFEKIGEFPYQASREGWGLCSDDRWLYKSDGTNRIYRLNKENYREEGFFEVYDHNGPVNYLNELEYIDGKIYANIYQNSRVVIIDPQTGAVTGDVNFSELESRIERYPNTDVFNGIAWDNQGKRLFVTGKKWNKLFQVRLQPVVHAVKE